MQVYSRLEDFPKPTRAVVTLGTFDGVHCGHQKILSRLNEIARQVEGESVVLTFFPHPRLILNPQDDSLRLLNTIDEKINLLRKAGLQHLVIHPFTETFSQMTYQDFVKQVLIDKLGVKTLVIGYDHHFGRNREGGMPQLLELAPKLKFNVEQIPEQDINNVAVSSTKIRNALQNGEISVANSYLGYDYSFQGTVVTGKKLGRTLGFPTANLHPDELYKLIPAEGIYAVKVEYENLFYKGMMSIGKNPTVGGTERTLEVNLLDFNGDLYGKKLRVYFKAWIRKEEKFTSLEDLQKQMEIDRAVTIKLLN